MAEGLGNVTWWGFSPALDLLDADVGALLEKTSISQNADKSEMNILLIGAGDIRHILKTIAKRKRHKFLKLNFFVYESTLELYARDMLLMAIALEEQSKMGLQEKSELFLELYGNVLIREQTMQYVVKMSNEFIKMVTDFDYLEDKLEMFDLSQLKFKERDFLEGIFKLWRNNDFKFDASKCWDLRMRQYLKTRYDSRVNAFDWDYNMYLIERGAEIINKSEYQSWRDRGTAFEFREGTYDTPNRTLVSARVFDHQGEKHGRMGYWGDTVVSPYVTFGIESEEQSLFQKLNGIFTKTAEDIAQFNIQAMLHELTTGKQYKKPVEKQENKAKLVEITEEEECTEDESNLDANEDQFSQEVPYQSVPVPGVKVVFLPIGSLKDHMSKNKYHNLFDVVYFSNSMVHHLTPDMNKIFADGCTIIIETAQFMIELKKDQMDEYVKRTSGMARAAGCRKDDTTESSCFTRHIYKASSS